MTFPGDARQAIGQAVQGFRGERSVIADSLTRQPFRIGTHLRILMPLRRNLAGYSSAAGNTPLTICSLLAIESIKTEIDLRPRTRQPFSEHLDMRGEITPFGRPALVDDADNLSRLSLAFGSPLRTTTQRRGRRFPGHPDFRPGARECGASKLRSEARGQRPPRTPNAPPIRRVQPA